MGCGALIAGHLNLEKSSLGSQVLRKAVSGWPRLSARSACQGRSEGLQGIRSLSVPVCDMAVGFSPPPNRKQAFAGSGAMLNALLGASMTPEMIRLEQDGGDTWISGTEPKLT